MHKYPVCIICSSLPPPPPSRQSISVSRLSQIMPAAFNEEDESSGPQHSPLNHRPLQTNKPDPVRSPFPYAQTAPKKQTENARCFFSRQGQQNVVLRHPLTSRDLANCEQKKRLFTLSNPATLLFETGQNIKSFTETLGRLFSDPDYRNSGSGSVPVPPLPPTPLPAK